MLLRIENADKVLYDTKVQNRGTPSDMEFVAFTKLSKFYRWSGNMNHTRKSSVFYVNFNKCAHNTM